MSAPTMTPLKVVAPGEISRIMLLVICIGLLLTGSLWILLPFLFALAWATMIVIATWPILLKVQQAAGGRRWVGVVVMTILALATFVGPLLAAVSTMFDAATNSPAVLRDLVARGLGPPPAWVANLPVVGARVTEKWTALAGAGPEALVETLRPYAASATSWVLALTGGVGAMLLQMLLTIALSAILYGSGETAAGGVLAFAHRIGGTRAEDTVQLAAKAVRSVALGVLVTALVQSALAGLGLWVSGVPHPGLFTAIAFVLAVAQLGPVLVLAPAVFWLYWSGHPGWATALLVWSLPVIALDNVLRPILIRRGVELPMLLIIAGVIGGLIGFGVIGLFVGPVVLAASYTLLRSWIAEVPR
jgi:predicted PurR-regulated permease PerM